MISAINNIYNSYTKYRTQLNNTTTKTAPMQFDSVSFTGGEKLMKNRADAVSHQLAQTIYSEAKPVMINFKNKLQKYFGALISSENFPDRPLLSESKGLSVRIKTPESICEKTASLGIKTKNELKDEMGDIIGARLVIKDSSKTDLIMKKLIEGVKNNDIKIFEIENYRTKKQYSYFTQKQLDSLEKISDKMRSNGVKRTETSIPSGYTALHLSTYLTDGFKGEIQILGQNVEKVKEIEDLLYKLKSNKSLASKYAKIEEEFEQLKTNKPLLRAITVYSKDQYTLARQSELNPQQNKKYKKFIPAPNYVPPEYDFNRIAKIKSACDAKYNKK